MKTIFLEILKRFQCLLFSLVIFLRDYLDSYLKASSYNPPSQRQSRSKALSYDVDPLSSAAQAIIDEALADMQDAEESAE